MNDNYSLSYLDLLMNSLGCVIVLFAISLLIVSPFKSQDGLEHKAEFIISVEWDAESDDDVDSYLQDPNGNIVNFQRREDGLMHLDRDDTGKRNDQMKAPSGENVTFAENIENVSKIIKINPSLKTIAAKKVTLKETGHEITVFRFTVTEDGGVTDIHDLEKKFTGHANDESNGGYPPEYHNSP
ncbi:MAG: hypothetical protein ACW99Q_29385, partial [Candidatus Kariarchaeaceae archaeon]